MLRDDSRIWMDGFSLTHSHGTGITTYSRGHAATLRELGAKLGILYGRPMPRLRDATEREVRFFDARARPNRSLRQRLFDMAMEPRGPLAQPVQISAMVDGTAVSAVTHRSFSTASLPPVDELWNANDAFGRALVNFSVTKRLLPVRVQGRPPALMHWTYSHAMRLVGTRNIYTIHDLIPLRLPWATLDIKSRWLNTLRLLVRDAEHIVTVSEHARQDVISQFGIAPERITNTYQPVFMPEHEMDGSMSVARLRAAHGLEPRGYFLFVSTIEPRKNLARMLDAYLAAGITTPFIIVGNVAEHGRDEMRLLTEVNGTRTADGRIRHLGYLPRLDVDILLRHARALCFPSLYEGFGLPAVEAMQLGTAVLTSDTSSLPEVVGDAALTVSPTDTRALAEALRALDGESGLRERLQEAGPRRAEAFSPARYAQRLGELYRRLGINLPGARA